MIFLIFFDVIFLASLMNFWYHGKCFLTSFFTMRCLKNTPESIQEAVKVLKAGGVIAHPADTCFGLAADFRNPEALKKLQKIKGRDGEKPMSVMLPAYMKPELEKYVQLDDFADFVVKTLLPGPVTIVLPKGPEVPDDYFPDTDLLGVRIPYDIQTDELLMKFRGPLVTTSANLSNEPVCSTCDEVVEAFKDKEDKPNLIIKGSIRNHCMPSTVIQVEDETIKILREGPITAKQLENLLGIKIN
jgi:L-threonylcarbamoyladenylate synthase